MSTVHPKAGGAALGTAFGVLLVSILHSVGVHMAPELPAAVTGFCAAAGAWLAPAGESPPPAPAVAQAPGDKPTAPVARVAVRKVIATPPEQPGGLELPPGVPRADSR